MMKNWLAMGMVVLALLAISALRFVGQPVVARPSAAAPAAPGQGGATALLFFGKVELNRATRADLIALPGIGPTKAQGILDLRHERGGTFSSVDDLLDVSGIGPRSLDKLRPFVTVDTDR